MAYFDAASSLPLHPVARQALLAALDEGWADPARTHREGRRARVLWDAARESAADSVGCRPDELSFTPSGTHALHTALAGALAGRRRVGRRLVVSAVEHSAVLHAAEAHERDGGAVSQVPVDERGRVEPARFAALLRGPAEPVGDVAPGGGHVAGAAVAALQSANHEVGTVQPVPEVAAACAEAGVPLLVDAAQSLGWAPVTGPWSLLAASAHKWGGPPGVGLLVVRKGVRFAPPAPADERESGRAPGFGNLPAVVAAAASLRAVRAEAPAEDARLRGLVARIRRRLPELVPDVRVVGDPERRLPHVVTFSCLYVDGEALLDRLSRAGFSVSSGSSCTSSTLTPSHVLRAMGVLSEGNVRVSLPPGTSEEDVERFLAVLPETVRGVRELLTTGAAPTADASSPDAPSSDAGPTAGTGAGAAAERAEAATEVTGTAEHGPGAPESEESKEAEGDGGGAGSGRTLDARGTLCPVPVIRLARVIGEVPVGGVVTVLADDEAARLDIPAWCEMRGQRFLGVEGTRFRVRRER
ncbi:aminotransferase class V-fold PLP-dependent enzyme [Streptomyces sp. AJS327]|uniref:cysteine desulfurase/sulfurtransferase TusA family protein n=1 Tax=Streptomyces sp. AJS327 TaxID=2545265 RepID=UPI0015DD7678|nr:cysteine desulfurase/sulfurtransferase TusA family protein [Streptomyces sp. AJS327]MBA0050263.1 aminotransferase class V-fold PLP-dependent enzyme [Streptomyces sp. AJS327]